VAESTDDILRRHLSDRGYEALMAVRIPKVHEFVAEAIVLCEPREVFVRTDDERDHEHTRQLALGDGSEKELSLRGHTVHFDGPNDQARDKHNTRYLVPEGVDLGSRINSVDRAAGLAEVKGFLKGAMAASGGTMLVCFHCLGPTNSVFSIPVMQITDSSYVAHSLSLLYHSGYEYFKTLEPGDLFFRVLHSQGELETAPNGAPISKRVADRRVYIDLDDIIVYSVNTQYAGNTVGLKKLSLRLAIRQAARQGWLAEHMFLTAVPGPHGRWTYFAGAFPSACGKTSTAMIPGQRIVGDDLGYLRKINGRVRAANSESGIFGIIRDVNPTDDPVIYEALRAPGEIIFSNVLVADKQPYWLGMTPGGDEMAGIPDAGTSYAGPWTRGMEKDEGETKGIPPSHKNARYTIRQDALRNCDPAYRKPDGVELGAIVYGGRDSDTHVPVTEAFDWTHGILTMGASIESETTAATLGAEGKREFNVMSNLDFLSMSIGQYLQMYLDFARGAESLPKQEGLDALGRAARPRRGRRPARAHRLLPHLRGPRRALPQRPRHRLHRGGIRPPVHHPRARAARQERADRRALRARRARRPGRLLPRHGRPVPPPRGTPAPPGRLRLALRPVNSHLGSPLHPGVGWGEGRRTVARGKPTGPAFTRTT